MVVRDHRERDMTNQSINLFDSKTPSTLREKANELLEEAMGSTGTCYATRRRKSFAERAVIGAEVSRSGARSGWATMGWRSFKATFEGWNRYVF